MRFGFRQPCVEDGLDLGLEDSEICSFECQLWSSLTEFQKWNLRIATSGDHENPWSLLKSTLLGKEIPQGKPQV